ncbi:MAG TPA: MBL fold metallo-hydrolase [Candidatus Hydrogenedentes bacterium]|nr:MBL fold metallo-hydrolase [Candidatus Hydrogenedentota bacterium]
MITSPVRLTTLVDNTVGCPGLLGEHGLAFWIETGALRVLFDTGSGAVLGPNAATLGVDLATTDAVVLSHGHYDHTGALSHVLDAAPRAEVFAHPAAFRAKYARKDDGAARYIGVPSPVEEAVRQQGGGLMLSDEPTEIANGLVVTGEVPRATDFEDTGGPFFLDENCTCPDPLLDDQALFFSVAQGTVVILGCSHAGLINTLQYLRQLTNGRPIHAVIGGMHLLSASEERINQTIKALQRFRVNCVGPAHCTGIAATVSLWSAFPKECRPCTVGATFTF